MREENISKDFLRIDVTDFIPNWRKNIFDNRMWNQPLPITVVLINVMFKILILQLLGSTSKGNLQTIRLPPHQREQP